MAKKRQKKTSHTAALTIAKSSYATILQSALTNPFVPAAPVPVDALATPHYDGGIHVTFVTSQSPAGCRITDAANRTATCEWTFNTTKHKYVKEYQVTWHYYTPSNGKWETASTSSTANKFSTYNIPANSDKAYCSVKPIQKDKYKKKAIPKNQKWKGTTARSGYAYIGETKNIPDAPSNIRTEIKGTKLICTVENYKYEGGTVTFEVLQDGTRIYGSKTGNILYTRASVEFDLDRGHKYAVRAMGTYQGNAGAWSDWSSDMSTAPGPTTNLTAETQPNDSENVRYRVMLRWDKAINVDDPNNDKYEVQYTLKEEYFDTSPDDVQTKDVSDIGEIPTFTTIIPDSAGVWFFRVRGVNSSGAGDWSNHATAATGQKPEPPTTWTYTASVKIGDPIVFNWTHNSADGSKQREARINLKINGVEQTPIQVTGDAKTYSYPTTGLGDGTVILWSVATKGAHNDYSDASVEREVRIYQQPQVSIAIDAAAYTDGAISGFPIDIALSASPTSQKLVSLDLAITSKVAYTIVDDSGHWIHVSEGDTVFTKQFDSPDSNDISFSIGPGDINFYSGAVYKLSVSAYMDSNLLASHTTEFAVLFREDELEPEGTVDIDFNNLTATIYPFCADEFGAELQDGGTLAVYRRNYDGTFTELESDIPFGAGRTVTDPHPALDYARYRIVARSSQSGRISYFDTTPEPVLFDGIVIQWRDEWGYTGSDVESYTGETLIIPYNIDVSDSNNMDVSLVEYIGREHPVSYYGTQKGYTSNWKCDIQKGDPEVIYALRRLARFAGDVYVREPNGSGYWANIKVQYSINHRTTTIPVSFTVTRVEGGI